MIKKFAFSGAFYDIVDAAHRVAAVDQNQLVCLSLQDSLNDGFSEAAQVCVCNLVGQFKILRHCFQHRAGFPKSTKEFKRSIFTDVIVS